MSGRGRVDDATASELSDLVRFITTQLIDHPEDLDITSDQRGQMVRIHLAVHDDDMGRVIGREGRIARAMRSLLTIAASRRGCRASLDIGR